MSAKQSPLVISQLEKSFGDRVAVDKVSFELQKGEVFGFLGPNGAGKSTTIRLILDFIKATNGDVTLLGGQDVVSRTKKHRDVGYLAGDVAFDEKLTGKATLKYLKSLGRTVDWSYVGELTRKFEADLDTPLKKLSKGNRQKIGLIQAFMHQPKLLILDEPTSGLDPLMKQVFYEEVRAVARQGTTVFVSSHDLTEVQKICDRAGFIRRGKLVAIENVSGDRLLRASRYVFTCDKTPDLKTLRAIKSVQSVEKTGDEYTVTVRGNISEFVSWLSEFEPKTLREHELELEELFMHYYTGGGDR